MTVPCAGVSKLRERERYTYIYIYIYIHTHTYIHVIHTYIPYNTIRYNTIQYTYSKFQGRRRPVECHMITTNRENRAVGGRGRKIPHKPKEDTDPYF